MIVSEKFRDRFRELADLLGDKKTAECAKMIGIAKLTFVNAYGLGIQPSAPTVKKIARYFNVSVDYLLGKSDEK